MIKFFRHFGTERNYNCLQFLEELSALHFRVSKFNKAAEILRESQNILQNSNSLNKNPLLRARLSEAECLLMKKEYEEAS